MVEKWGICPECYEDEQESTTIEDDLYECNACGAFFTHQEAVDALEDYADSMREWQNDCRLEREMV